jgi:hypothetical protein
MFFSPSPLLTCSCKYLQVESTQNVGTRVRGEKTLMFFSLLPPLLTCSCKHPQVESTQNVVMG